METATMEFKEPKVEESEGEAAAMVITLFIIYLLIYSNITFTTNSSYTKKNFK